MKVSLPSARLQAAVALVASFAAKKNHSTPIMAHVLLEADEGGSLVLTGTDLEGWAQVRVEAVVKEGGALTVPADRLGEIASKAPAPETDLTVKEGNTLIVRSGKSRLDLKGLSREDYPAFDPGDSQSFAAMPGSYIVGLDTAVSFCVDERHQRGPGFRGIGMFPKDGELVVAGLDGIRFSEVTMRGSDLHAAEPMLLAKPTLSRAGKAFAADEPVMLVRTQNFIGFLGRTAQVFVKLLGDAFPPYAPVMAKAAADADRWIEADRQHLLQMLERIDVVAKAEELRPVRLEVIQDRLRVYTQTPDAGMGEEDMEVDHSGGPILFYSRTSTLLDMLSRVDGPKVRIEASARVNAPVLVLPADPDENAPVRVMVFGPVNTGSHQVAGWPAPQVATEGMDAAMRVVEGEPPKKTRKGG